MAAMRRGHAGNAAKAGAGTTAGSAGTTAGRGATTAGSAATTAGPAATTAGPATKARAVARTEAIARTEAAPGDEYSCARAWAALTAAHGRITGQLSTALDQACGLSITDFEILLRLDQAPASGIRIGGLNPAVRLTQPALSRAVARLERRGYLARAGPAEDRRGVLIAVTPAGQETLRQAVPVHAQTIRDLLLAPLAPGEQDLLARVLARVAES
jgi:DNA-binding MarR family transcriptional regulator